MAQKIYDNFLGGISDSDKMGPMGSYWKGYLVSPRVNGHIGYILPQTQPTKADGISAVSDLIVDFEASPNLVPTYVAYGLGSAGHIYKIDIGGSPAIVSAAAPWPYHISAGLGGASGPAGIIAGDIINYPVGTTNYGFYSWENATSGSIGRFDWNLIFDDDYISTSAANAGMLSAGFVHPMKDGDDGLLYIGNGNKLVSYDGQVGVDGTFDEQALDLPVGWEITSLFKTGDYLGIAAWKKVNQEVLRTDSAIFLWDYVSETYNKSIPINDNKIITTYNFNGDIIFFTQNRNSPYMMRLTEGGSENLGNVHFLSGAADSWGVIPKRNAIDVFENKLIFGYNLYNSIFSYGQYKSGYPLSLTNDWSVSGGASNNIGAIRSCFFGNALISYQTDANTYGVASMGNEWPNNAQWAGLYTDINQKVRINYVKFYFKPLTSGDTATPTLDIDYGTSVTLTDARGNTTISYANDGAITSKKFNVKRDCHTFRPAITWSAGHMTVSKIIIDYTPMEDI